MANLIWNNSAIKKLKDDLGDRLELVGVLVESEVVKNINQMKIVDTGRYKNSITHETNKKELVTTTGTNVEYAPWLEIGNIKMQPRPAFRTALYTSEKKIEEILTK